MPDIKISDIEAFVESNIGEFHNNKLEKLKKLKLDVVLRRKNPYLFKAKNFATAGALVQAILEAYLSAQEETLFGDFLEKLAIYICAKTFGGIKSSAEGIDMDFTKEGIRYLVCIKSGPNWGNSSQIKKMIDNFKKAKKIIGTNSLKSNIVAINGCCYGKENADKGDYKKISGQKFWEFISGNSDLYIQIIEPLGFRAKEKNQHFDEAFATVVNKFTKEFLGKYCKSDKIDWAKLVQFNSGA